VKDLTTLEKGTGWALAAMFAFALLFGLFQWAWALTLAASMVFPVGIMGAVAIIQRRTWGG
jgi:hypothetical protein